MRDCLGKVSRLQMYLPASLAVTFSMTRAQLVGFWKTTLNLGSPEKVELSRVRRSMVELPWSTDHETVVDWKICIIMFYITQFDTVQTVPSPRLATMKYFHHSLLGVTTGDKDWEGETSQSIMSVVGCSEPHTLSCINQMSGDSDLTCFIQMLQWRATESPMSALTRLLLTELSSNLGSTLLAAATGSLDPIIGAVV